MPSKVAGWGAGQWIAHRSKWSCMSLNVAGRSCLTEALVRGHLGVLQKWKVLQMGREFSGIRSASLSWARQGKGFALTSAALQGCPELGIKFLLPPLRISPSESRASGVRRALHREQCQNQLDLMTA